jgi:hypothetical protein
MYFPYLRGKQEEQFAVLESTAGADLVLPVFEPTSDSNAHARRYERIAASGKRLALIVNSAHGRPAPAPGAIGRMIQAIDGTSPGAVLPAYEIRANSTAADVQAFCAGYADRRIVLVHRSNVLPLNTLAAALQPLTEDPVHVLLEGGAPLPVIRTLRGIGTVLLRDGFERHPTNGAYPARTAFDDLTYTYDTLGYQGMGDFSIVGDLYSIGGGAAKHVALHLTEAVSGPTLVTNHFVSRTAPTKGNVQGKYFDALQQLVSHTQEPPAPAFRTSGVGKYHQSHRNRHFPNLGPPKRWSMMHHFELVDRELRARGATPFV